jgi:hypothetical protein
MASATGAAEDRQLGVFETKRIKTPDWRGPRQSDSCVPSGGGVTLSHLSTHGGTI